MNAEELRKVPCEFNPCLDPSEPEDFVIDELTRYVEPDGMMIFEWKTSDGALVSVGEIGPGTFAVQVERGDKRVRAYEGARAKAVYDSTVKLFEEAMANQGDVTITLQRKVTG